MSFHVESWQYIEDLYEGASNLLSDVADSVVDVYKYLTGSESANIDLNKAGSGYDFWDFASGDETEWGAQLETFLDKDDSVWDTVLGWGADIGTALNNIPKEWVTAGIGYLKRGEVNDMAEAIRRAAADARDATMEAAKPKDVDSPLGHVRYDEETGTFGLSLSEEMAGVAKGLGSQYDEVSKNLQPLLGDRGKAINNQAQMMQAARDPSQQRATDKMLNFQQAAGMLGSSGGAEQQRGLMQGISEASATDYANASNTVDNNISNYLTQQDNLLKSMISVGSIPSDLANISTGAGSTLGTAAVAANKPYLEANTVAATSGAAGNISIYDNFLTPKAG